ncbi:S8 family peptidase [candidate division KSB1 bacterium]|nr:S8 family peptidase [candidate division KSB1 bacterium]
MNRLLKLLTCTACALAVLIGPGGLSQAAEHSPTLDETIQTTPAGKLIPVVLVLDSRVSMDEVYPNALALAMDARRDYVIRTLKERFAMMSESVWPYLADEKKAGRVSLLRPLWVVNSIRVVLDPALIADIDSKFPEVVYILSDQRYDNTLDAAGWGLLDIEAPRCWEEVEANGSGVILGHKDSGCNTALPAFANNLWVNPGEDLNGNGHVDTIEQNEIDDDGNGYVDDFYGWNFEDDNAYLYPTDGSGHGNLTASVIASALGTATNPCDTSAVAPGVKLMILKSYTSQSSVWEASQYAIDHGAMVISASLSFKLSDCGDTVRDCPNLVMHRRVSEMELAAGIIHANSTGNYGLSNPVPMSCSAPSTCPPPAMTDGHEQQGGVSSIVAVSAYLSGHVHFSQSGHGPGGWSRDDICFTAGSPISRMPFCGPAGSSNAYPAEYEDYPWQDGAFPGLAKPDVTAPTVVSAVDRGGFCSSINGTSGATPHVGAALALIYSAFPGITPEDCYRYLIAGIQDQGEAGWDSLWGFGMVRPYAAILEGRGLRGTIAGTAAIGQSPVEGVRVSVAGNQPVYSNSNGVFRLVVAAGDYDVLFERYGYLDIHLNRHVTAQGTVNADVELQVAPQTTLAVSVVNYAGAPLADMPVWIPEIERSGITDVNGYATFNDIYAGAYDVHCGALPWAEHVVNADVHSDPLTVTATLNYSPQATVSGPDEYGYYIYDNYDSPQAAFEWVEINPNAGGLNGECLNITGDNCAPRTLPFDFQFYGVSTTSVRIHANGFVLFGTTCSQDWGSNPIPRVEAPNGYVAPMFTDWMPTAASCVYYLADNANHRVIVEWYNVIEYYETGPARFEIILYDPQFMPTPSGDGAMKMQYDGWEGRYEGSVGVENPTGTDGLQYYFQGYYEPHAAPIVPGRALLVTTDPNLSAADEARPTSPQQFLLSQNYPNPFNPSTTFAITVPHRAQVRLTLFDVLGREAAVLLDGVREPGVHSVTFNATGLSSGIYFARLESGGAIYTVRKIMLLK